MNSIFKKNGGIDLIPNIFYLVLVYMISVNLSYTQTKAEEKPNFIFILTDDHRYDLLGSTGNEIIKTPHLDQLAEDGILFKNAHVTSAICTPSRVSIFLSQFERKHAVNFNSGTSVSDEAWKESYPVVLKNNGYYTGYIGKNHAPIGKWNHRLIIGMLVMGIFLFTQKTDTKYSVVLNKILKLKSWTRVFRIFLVMSIS